MSGRVVIVANGVPTSDTALAAWVHPGDLLIAADGGARLLRENDLVPDYVIGDFDSLTALELAQLEANDVQLQRHPVDKDETDLELALHFALEHKPDEILILAALGGRWDQSLANILLLANPMWRSVLITLVDGSQRINLIAPNHDHQIVGKSGDTVSLIPIGNKATGVTTHGLQWGLDDEMLEFGTTRGVSNVIIATKASVAIREGLLVCVVSNNQHVEETY